MNPWEWELWNNIIGLWHHSVWSHKNTVIQWADNTIELLTESKQPSLEWSDTIINMVKWTHFIIEQWVFKLLVSPDTLQNVTLLDISEECFITDISEISQLIWLQYLSLTSNRISDISPLKELVRLKELHLINNLISDISPLKELFHLEKLEIGFNNISDVSPLKDLHMLKELSLWWNMISNIRCLDGLKRLHHLDIGNQACSEIAKNTYHRQITYLLNELIKYRDTMMYVDLPVYLKDKFELFSQPSYHLDITFVEPWLQPDRDYGS
jgi:Leucine-rich repeat (LRR) protein